MQRRCDLNLVLVFDALWTQRQVSRAAVALGTTQPTLSNALRRLRQTFNDPLFVHSGRAMLPTPLAETLAGHWRDAAAGFRRGMSVAAHFDPQAANRMFTLVMTDIAEAVILPKIVHLCRTEAPHVLFRTAQMSSDRILDALRSGEVDLAIGYIPALGSGMKRHRLFETEYVVISQKEHPAIPRGGRLTRPIFIAGRHAVADATGTGHVLVERALRREGVDSRIGVHVAGFLSLPRIVAFSDMFATVPRALARLMQHAVPIEIHRHPLELPSLQIQEFWHERFDADAGIRWLRNAVKRAIRDEPILRARATP